MKKKRCYRCSETCKGGEKGYLGAGAKSCPRCGGTSFYYGQRTPRTLWPALPEEGPDTLDENGEVIPGAWEAQVLPTLPWNQKRGD